MPLVVLLCPVENEEREEENSTACNIDYGEVQAKASRKRELPMDTLDGWAPTTHHPQTYEDERGEVQKTT